MLKVMRPHPTFNEAVTEAFENGLLNNEQLLEVHEKYNTAFNEMFGDR